MSDVKTRLELPKQEIRERELNPEQYQQALDLGLSPIVARILAARGLKADVDLKHWLNPGLQDLDSPKGMADLDKASARLTQALTNQEVIALETDHDCDGQTSHAVLYLALTDIFKHPKDKVQSFIGHRMEEGYGLSEALANRILAADPKPSLVITADNGSSDEARIAKLKQAGIDVIVTDHHAIPEDGVPKSALAVLNPTRPDCDYPDPYIAGCMVAWLFMAYQRTALINQKHIDKQAPSLAKLLDFVAVGTVADCVSLSRSINNRIVIRFGMKLMAQFRRPCWRAVRDLVGESFDSEALGFKIGPLLNSDGRLESALGSVSFLLSEDDATALDWVRVLNETNIKRKAIQKQLTTKATALACAQDDEQKRSLSIYLKDGHAGIHGITASRIRESFGKPTFIFSPKLNHPELVSGSGRSVDNCHLRDALVEVQQQYPSIFTGFGGHQGAAGATIALKDIETFSLAFEQAVLKQCPQPLKPYQLSDGNVSDLVWSVEQYQELLETLEPFGREFDAPLFELDGVLEGLRWIGTPKIHASFRLRTPLHLHSCVWFNVKQDEDEEMEPLEGQTVRVLFSFQIDTYRAIPSLKCLVRNLEAL